MHTFQNQSGPPFALVSVTIPCNIFEGLQTMFKGTILDRDSIEMVCYSILLLLLAFDNPSHSAALASVTPNSPWSPLKCRLLLIAFTTDARHFHHDLTSMQCLAK